MLTKVTDGAKKSKNDNQTIISYKHLNSNGIIVIVSIKYHKPLRKEAKKFENQSEYVKNRVSFKIQRKGIERRN